MTVKEVGLWPPLACRLRNIIVVGEGVLSGENCGPHRP